MRQIMNAISAAIIVAAGAANANDRGNYQSWENEYTARDLLSDCSQRRTMSRCMFFIQTVAQASFWFDKCIPTGTSLTEIGDITRAFVKDNAYAADGAATNVLLTAIHMKWKCP